MKECSDKNTTSFGKVIENKGQDVYIQNSVINNVGRNKIQHIHVLKCTAINSLAHSCSEMYCYQ